MNCENPVIEQFEEIRDTGITIKRDWLALVRKDGTIQKLCNLYDLEIKGDVLVEKEEIVIIPNQPSIDLTVDPKTRPNIMTVDLTSNHRPGSDFHDFSSLNTVT